jgi:hypothetical protein
LNAYNLNVVKIPGSINQIFEPSLVSERRRIPICKTLARLTLAYGNESWIVRRADKRRLLSTECVSRGLQYTILSSVKEKNKL